MDSNVCFELEMLSVPSWSVFPLVHPCLLASRSADRQHMKSECKGMEMQEGKGCFAGTRVSLKDKVLGPAGTLQAQSQQAPKNRGAVRK